MQGNLFEYSINSDNYTYTFTYNNAILAKYRYKKLLYTKHIMQSISMTRKSHVIDHEN